jgi:hypothetical protein
MSLAAERRSELEGKKPVEECAIASQALPKVFCRDVVAAIPLFLEFGAFLGELLGDSLDDGRDQGIGLLDGVTRLIDERGLHLIPAGAKVAQLSFGEEREFIATVGLRGCRRGLRSRGFCS